MIRIGSEDGTSEGVQSVVTLRTENNCLTDDNRKNYNIFTLEHVADMCLRLSAKAARQNKISKLRSWIFSTHMAQERRNSGGDVLSASETLRTLAAKRRLPGGLLTSLKDHTGRMKNVIDRLITATK